MDNEAARQRYVEFHRDAARNQRSDAIRELRALQAQMSLMRKGESK